jgi:hypothetical protein
MLRDALLTTFNGSLKDVIKIKCMGSPQNTLTVEVSLNRGYRAFEFYTLRGKFCSVFFPLSAERATIFRLPFTPSEKNGLPFL